MKFSSTVFLFVAASTLALVSPLAAQHHGDHSNQSAASAKGQLVKVTDVDAAWLADARKSYPLDVCVMSDEKLGSMGDATEWVYRAKGQPDRLVKFCCDGCIEDFLADAATGLAKIDAAAQKKTQK